MYIIYRIINRKDKSVYVGLTSNLQKRVDRHRKSKLFKGFEITVETLAKYQNVNAALKKEHEEILKLYNDKTLICLNKTKIAIVPLSNVENLCYTGEKGFWVSDLMSHPNQRTINNNFGVFSRIDSISTIRNRFLRKIHRNYGDAKTIDLLGACFVANEKTIFGNVNNNYTKAEIEWYNSQSLYVDDLYNIYGSEVKIWEKHASLIERKIHSNYGYLIFSNANGNQYENVKKELMSNPDSRRGSMIYTRPTIHNEVDITQQTNPNDFICTNSVTYFINNNQLDCIVQMRSNDALFGYKNDYAWNKYVLEKLSKELRKKCGDIIWQVASLHIYTKHIKMLKNYTNSYNG